MSTLFNVLTVDLEEWFVVEALASRYRFEDWPSLESTLERNCIRLLKLFARNQVTATWFILGWCAEQHPDLIRRIADSGHEIGCHSYRHIQVDSLTPEEFREDTERALEAISKPLRSRPIGYRAPSWSINNTVPWAFDILSDLGFEYDSSIFPIKHDLYGMPTGPRTLHKLKTSNGNYLFEFPASTQRFFGQNIPLGGGGYLRHSPYWYSRRMIRKLNHQGQPVVAYVHPWEFDPDPPEIPGMTYLQRLRMRGSTSVFEQKLDRLIGEFEFTTMRNHIRLATRSRIGFER